jgi:hypothetical protein
MIGKIVSLTSSPASYSNVIAIRLGVGLAETQCAYNFDLFQELVGPTLVTKGKQGVGAIHIDNKIALEVRHIFVRRVIQLCVIILGRNGRSYITVT